MNVSGLDIALIEKHIYISMLFSARMLVFLTILPHFSENIPSGILRTGISFALCLPLIVAAAANPDTQIQSLGQFTYYLMLAKEAALGAFLAICVGIAYWSVSSAGNIVDILSGSQMSDAISPGTSDSVSYGALLFSNFFNYVFVIAGGIQFLIPLLYQSYSVIGVMEWVPSFDLSTVQYLIELSSNLLALAFVIFMPIIASIFLVDIALGFYSKYNSQLNVTFLSSPLKLLVALICYLLGFDYFLIFFEQLIDGYSSVVSLALESLS
ncbi:MAG: flagellar biosynthetic protein FliR [Methylocystaceae bacterium]|nr:flagellar biosynthetic protein FliR [Methylocystaceae bacterium]